MSDQGRLSRAWVVAALGHAVAIFLSARLAPRALPPPALSDASSYDGLIAVEMFSPSEPEAHESVTLRSEPPKMAAPTTNRGGAKTAAGAVGRGDSGAARGESGEGAHEPEPPAAGEGFSPIDTPAWEPRLRLSDVVDLSPEGPPAPTRPPRSARIVTADDTNEAVRSIVREEDRKLGLGNPQETVIAAAVQEAGRAAGVPSGTHFVVTVVLDADGNVTDASIHGDSAGNGAWPSTLASIRSKLAKPVPLGVDERGKGARVSVDATLLHVFPSGSDKSVVMGSCPQMPLIGGEQAPSFMSFGGEQYLEPSNGLCALSDGDFKDSLKTIVVRTKTRTHHAREAPPALSSFPPRPRPKKLLPTPMELIMKAINGK